MTRDEVLIGKGRLLEEYTDAIKDQALHDFNRQEIGTLLKHIAEIALNAESWEGVSFTEEHMRVLDANLICCLVDSGIAINERVEHASKLMKDMGVKVL
jgi:hypothetical protein